MGWFSSIHVKTADMDEVLRCLREVGEHKCFVGRSGQGWTGIYSKKCEETGGEHTRELASAISPLIECYVLGLCLREDEFSFWLFTKGQLRDRHPPGSLAWLSSKRRHEIQLLAMDDQGSQQIEEALEGKKKGDPETVFGVSGQDFATKAYQDLARLKSLPPEERRQLVDQYGRLRSRAPEDLRRLCQAIGVEEHDWNYSELETTETAREMVLRHLD